MSRAVAFSFAEPQPQVTVKLSNTAKITGIQCFDALESWDFPGEVRRIADNEIVLDFTFEHFTDLGDKSKSVEINRIRRERNPFIGKIVVFYEGGLSPVEEGGEEEVSSLLPIAIADMLKPKGGYGTIDNPWPNPLTEAQGIELEQAFRTSPLAVHHRYLSLQDWSGLQLRLGDKVIYDGVEFLVGLKGHAYFLLNEATSIAVQHLVLTETGRMPVNLIPRLSEDEEALRQLNDCNIFIQ